MKIIIGLGNPGKQYEGTRHNAGFVVLDRLVCANVITPVGECISFNKADKFEALIGETMHKGEKIILAKPQTFMNLSGKAVSKILSYYKADTKDLIVISDDIDLPIGTARVREIGSSGGQKGLQNIIDELGTAEFTRIRIGVRSINGSDHETENPSSKFDAIDFVLSKFDKRELPVLDKLMDEVVEYIALYIGNKEPMPAHTISTKPDVL